MSDTYLSLLIAAIVFAGGLAGLSLQRVLPEAHLSKETLDAVRLTTGMLSVLASLILGLLTATAKSNYDSTEHAIETYSAALILLDETLRDYGDQTLPARRLLREYTQRVLDSTWPKDDTHQFTAEDPHSGAMLEQVRNDIRAITPANPDQVWLHNESLRVATVVLQQRWMLIEDTGSNVRGTVMVILVCWIVLIFVSFGLSAPRNATVRAAFCVCALAIGGSVFLILELDTPFDGLLQISSAPIVSALEHMK